MIKVTISCTFYARIGIGFNMCGLVGFCDQHKLMDQRILVRMRDSLAHRGPDSKGLYFDVGEYCALGLGHQRLSVLDLSDNGNQPMSFEHLELCYNGEVYNYKEIRLELIEKNYNFFSDSDTEVILKAFHCWGVQAIERFNGMFAFSLYDKKNKKLYLVRDRVGIKPLYWGNIGKAFAFASEIRSFKEIPKIELSINRDALTSLLKYNYIPSPISIYENIFKLNPVSILTIDSRGNKETKKILGYL